MSRSAPYDRDTALKAAMELFWRKGYHATSLKDLEQALSMKPGSIYAAFKSKDMLFRLTLVRYFEKNATALDECVAQSKTPLEGLANFLRSHATARDGACAPPCMLAKTVLETADTPSDANAEARAHMRKMAERFAAVYKAAQEQGELPPDIDPENLARKLQVKLMGLTLFAQREDDQAVLCDLAEDLAQEIMLRDRPAA